MKLSLKVLSVLTFLSYGIFAQVKNVQDTLKLPFAIAKEKQLSEEDLAAKKEGMYVTGVPDISSDPVNGFGVGVEGSIFFNGKKSDPFFKYTPYRAEIDLALFVTSKQQKEIMLTVDVPYILNTKWRLRGELAYEINPNLLYFGVNEKETIPGLSYFPLGDSTQNMVHNATYAAYESSLTGQNTFYHQYTKKEAILNISMERSMYEGRIRLLAGYEIAKLNVSPFTGNSLLATDFQNGLIRGVGQNLVSFVQAGFIYDTRDLEGDPSSGIFAEVTNELSLKALGSQFNFNKTFAHVNVYQRLFPGSFKKLIFAARFSMGYTALDAPFYEYQDQWTSEGSVEGLGGGQTLRGFKQSRFLSKWMFFNNIELRYRFGELDLLKQHLAFSAVPFFDFGAVWDSGASMWNQQLHNIRSNGGLGLRIAWNVNTILRFDYAISKEDKQFFFQIGHCF
jgi:outer membrane protein assembly factor BamA